MHGWLILDKPLHMTSFQAVAQVRRIFSTKKAGHAGTLDPLASGVLPIALGEATKTIAYAQETEKEYRFTITFGEARDTDDLEGVVIQTSDVRPSRDAIIKALPNFIGTIMQAPPIFSAIKVDGQRSYDLARSGTAAPLPPRPVQIHSLTLDHYEMDGVAATLTMQCGKGTYVRSLARDLSLMLGTCGHISSLRRTKVGKFSETNAILLDKLKKIVHSAPVHDILLSVGTVLDDIPVLPILPKDEERLRLGQAVALDQPLPSGMTAAAQINGKVVALGLIDQGVFKPKRVFNY